MMCSGNIYLEILKNVLPRGYSLAFAYGSGVFKQVGHLTTKVSTLLN